MQWFKFKNVPIEPLLLVVDGESLFIAFRQIGHDLRLHSDFESALVSAGYGSLTYLEEKKLWVIDADDFNLDDLINSQSTLLDVVSNEVNPEDLLIELNTEEADDESERDETHNTAIAVNSSQTHEEVSSGDSAISSSRNIGSLDNVQNGSAQTIDGVAQTDGSPARASGGGAAQSRTNALQVDSDEQAGANREAYPDVVGVGGNYRTSIEPYQDFSDSQRFKANIKALELINTKRKVFDQSEKDVLFGFSGWGGLLGAYSDAINDPAFKSAIGLIGNPADSFLTGYFTDKSLIDAVWRKVVQSGFTGGRILETSCGTGRFVSFAPDEIERNSHFTLVEKDPLTASIAGHLHAASDVHKMGFEDFIQLNSVSGNQFDLVIGNVPFGEHRLFDADTGDSISIHNFFIRKSIDSLAEGAVFAVISSTYFLDSKTDVHRAYVNEHAALMGAFRLPNNSFVGTSVSADLLFFKKRSGDEKIAGELDFVDVVYGVNNGAADVRSILPRMLTEREATKNKAFSAKDKDNIFSINKVFANGGGVLCGDPEVKTDQYGKLVVGISGSKANAIALISGAQLNMQYHGSPTELDKHGKPFYSNQIIESTMPSVGSWRIFDGKPVTVMSFRQLVDDVGNVTYLTLLGDVEVSGRNITLLNGNKVAPIDIVKDYIVVRDLALAVRNGESSALRGDLEFAYDRFYERYGSVNHRTIAKIISADAMSPIVFGLEVYNSSTATATKSKWLTEGFKVNKQRDIKATNLKEAAMIIFSGGMKYDDDSMKKVLGCTVDEAVSREKGVLFREYDDNGNFKWVHAVEYLLGNVREKLNKVNSQIERHPDLYINKEYLEGALPARVLIGDIAVRIGANWIGDEVILGFLRNIFDKNNLGKNVTVSISRDEITDQRSVIIKPAYKSSAYEKVVSVMFGTKECSLPILINHCMKSTQPTVTVEVDGKRVVDAKATGEAIAKKEELELLFESYVASNPSVAKYLEDTYNEIVNVNNYSIDDSYFDGYQFPDIREDFVPRKHQRKFVVTTLMGKTCFNADCVGAGKTAMQIMLAYESKRLGITNKTAITILNSTILQYARACSDLYPNANFCLVTKDDLVGYRRRMLLGKINSTDWDFVVLPYSIMSNITAPLDYTLKQYYDDLESARILFDSAVANEERLAQKKALREIKSIESSIQKAVDDNSRLKTFPIEYTGIDGLIYDEAHKLKNLKPILFAEIEGASLASSDIAMREYVKIKYIQEKYHKGREVGLAMFTATPLSNSMSEIYTWLRFCRESELVKYGIHSFNDFVALFAESVAALETKPEGYGFQMKSRLSKFHNIPELLALFRSFTQLSTRDQLDLPVPDYDVVPISVESNPLQQAIMKHILARGAALRGSSGMPERGADNMLSVTTSAKLVALSPRSLNPMLPETPTKVHAAMDALMDQYQKTRDKNSAFLVFSDVAVPPSKASDVHLYSCYWEARDYLISKGVPPEKIAIVHEAKTDAQLDELFRKVRTGEVSFCFGSTAKLGTGTNIQDKLAGAVSLDVPWTAKDFEQRDGRTIRTGNENSHVLIWRAVTKNTADTFAYETVKRKKDLMDVAMSDPRLADRRISEEVDLSYETLIAESSGNHIVRDRMRLQSELKMLESRYVAHQNTQSTLRAGYDSAVQVINELTPLLPKYKEILTSIKQSLDDSIDQYGEPFTFDENQVVGHAKENGLPPPNIAELTRRQEAERLRHHAFKLLDKSGAVIEEIADRRSFMEHLKASIEDAKPLYVSVSSIRLTVDVSPFTGAILGRDLDDRSFSYDITPTDPSHSGLYRSQGQCRGLGLILRLTLAVPMNVVPLRFKSAHERIADARSLVDMGEPVLTEYPHFERMQAARKELAVIESEIAELAVTATAIEGDDFPPPSPDELALLYLYTGGNLDPLNVPLNLRKEMCLTLRSRASIVKFLESHGKGSYADIYVDYLIKDSAIYHALGIDIGLDEEDDVEDDSLDDLTTSIDGLGIHLTEPAAPTQPAPSVAVN